MNRYTLAARILPGQDAAFHAVLNDCLPALRSFIDENALHNFSLWQAEDLVFAYAESPGTKPDLTSILEPFADVLEVLPHPMRLMYSDIGIVREDKSQIRHRVFMTQLVPGAEEEYKHRHDVLAAESLAARGGAPNPGPDSNFTIWSSAGYIFGYDEIDVSMEHPMTEEERASTIVWETRMFEIMHWITNDCDWISGEHHAEVQQLLSC